MKVLTTISIIALLTTPALALPPEQIAQQQQEQALQNERNRQQIIEAERIRESRNNYADFAGHLFNIAG